MSEERDYETEAQADGWVPQEEWKGEPDKWKDAKQFVEDGENILPIVRRKLRMMEEKFDRQSAAIERLIETQGEQKRKAVEKALKEAKVRQRQAIREENEVEADEIEKEIAALEQEQQKADVPSFHPAFLSWKEENSWYGKDDDLTAEANMLGFQYINSGQYQEGDPRLYKAIERRIKKEFPEKFRNPNRDEPAAVEQGQRKAPVKKGRAYQDLPADAKKACDELVREIPNYTREKYLENYEWED